MNRRELFLGSMAVAAVAAFPIPAPAKTLTLTDIVTPEIFKPYLRAILQDVSGLAGGNP